ncbi:hypothetical protein Q9966_011577 [Columba livia]|nr:hypothetical protein Q9966_011577 [Columba livia]
MSCRVSVPPRAQDSISRHVLRHPPPPPGFLPGHPPGDRPSFRLPSAPKHPRPGGTRQRRRARRSFGQLRLQHRRGWGRGTRVAREWRAGPGAARTQRCSRCPPPRAERGGAAGLHLPCCTGGGRPSRADAAGGSRRRLCPCGAGGAAPAQVGAAGGGPAARGWALLARGVPAEGTRPRRPLPCSPLRRPPPSPAGPPRTPLRARLPPALRPFPGSPRGPRATRTRCSVSQPPGRPWIRPWRHRLPLLWCSRPGFVKNKTSSLLPIFSFQLHSSRWLYFSGVLPACFSSDAALGADKRPTER